jgi:hypothetical protein
MEEIKFMPAKLFMFILGYNEEKVWSSGYIDKSPIPPQDCIFKPCQIFAVQSVCLPYL